MFARKVGVVGAGVAGLSMAYELLRADRSQSLSLTVYGLEPQSVLPAASRHASAISWPATHPEDPRVQQWFQTTLEHLEEIAKEPASGVRLMDIHMPLWAKETALPWWAQVFPERHRWSDRNELGEGHTCGHVFIDGPVITPPDYMHWLRAQIEERGGKFERLPLTTLHGTLDDCAVVINCAGAASSKLLNDKNQKVQRLPFLHVQKPTRALGRAVFDGDGPYATVVPHEDYVFCSADPGDPEAPHDNISLSVSGEEVDLILERANFIAPELGGLTRQHVLRSGCALKPKRDKPAVELLQQGGRVFVNNYGHNSVFALGHGSAVEIAQALLVDPTATPPAPTGGATWHPMGARAVTF